MFDHSSVIEPAFFDWSWIFLRLREAMVRSLFRTDTAEWIVLRMRHSGKGGPECLEPFVCWLMVCCVGNKRIGRFLQACDRIRIAVVIHGPDMFVGR